MKYPAESHGFRQDGYLLVGDSEARLVSNTTENLECGKKFRNLEGMGWIVTCLFIVGETAGGGLIAMPAAMVSAGKLHLNPEC